MKIRTWKWIGIGAVGVLPLWSCGSSDNQGTVKSAILGTLVDSDKATPACVTCTPTPVPTATPTPVPTATPTPGPCALEGYVRPPVFGPGSGYYDAPVSVNVHSDTEGAQIYCTKDARVPTTSSMLYTGPIVVSQSTILSCKAFKSCMNPSANTQALYVIQGSAPAENCRFVRVEISLGVDQVEQLRLHDGVMDLVHINGLRPEDPLVVITQMDGSVNVVDRWNLDPFHAETDLACNWSPNGCVSSALNLGIPDMLPGSVGVIPPSTLDLIVGRGSVLVQEPNIILIQDPVSNWSGYWFFFEYWYAARP